MSKEAFIFILGLMVFAAALYWLAQANTKDRQTMAEILGMVVVQKGEEERGKDYVLGNFRQSLAMQGEMHGRPAGVWVRSVRRFTKHNSKNMSLQTVLAFDLKGESQTAFRIEPALTGKLQSWFGGDQPVISSGDPEFDRLFRFTSQDSSAAIQILNPEMRNQLLAFRKAVVGDMPNSDLGRFSGDLMMGIFAVEGNRATYTVAGTPSEKIARHFAMAGPFLAEFAERLQKQA
ncbi:MAG: hypothetical protein HC845_05980 [Akkermansiaceae bacterium]|nr:hypothetical protein [Akkermansiaceae bacterium]